MQITFILPLILIVFAIVALMLYIRNKKSLTTGYDISKPDTETIMVPSSKLTLLSVVMMAFGGLFLLVVLSSTDILFNFKDAIAYIMIGLSIVLLGIFITGMRLFLKRNQVVQLQFEKNALKFLDIDWSPRKGRTLLLLLFNQKFISINYEEIYTVEISQSAFLGDSIVIRTMGDMVYLPFVYDNKQQMETVVDKIKSRISKQKTTNLS